MTTESPKKVKFFDRQMIINKQVQAGILGYSAFLISAVLLIQYALNAFVLGEGMEGANVEWSVQNFLVIGLMLVLLVSTIFYGFYLTNRIAGPIHRLQTHMEAMNEGKEVPDLTFRKKDFFQDILIPYNLLIKKLKK
jgi:hypothetical protein